MKDSSARPADGIEALVDKYSDTLFRICLTRLRSEPDAEDAVQETFLRLVKKRPRFASDAHEKAWLIRVALNVCTDLLRKRTHRAETPLEEIGEVAALSDAPDVTQALLSLPEEERTVLTLHYLEGYTTKEIASGIGKSASTVKMRLQKGRELFRDLYGKETE